MLEGNGTPGRRLLSFVGHYPSPYKPYYDTQFTEFLRAGYDLQIMAALPLDDIVNAKVVDNGLLERTKYYPESGSRAGAATAARAFLMPVRAARFLNSARSRGPRQAVVELLGMLGLPGVPPDVVLIHELGVALRFSGVRDWFPGVRMGMYYHGGEVPSVRPHEAGAVAQTFRAFDTVFTNTEFARQQAIARGCPADAVMILPVGFDLTDYRAPDHRQYRRDDVLHLFSAGRLSEEKGLEYALDALRSVIESGRRSIRYSIAGEGYLRPTLEEYVSAHALGDYVEFLGALNTNQMIAAMGEADALLLPSIALGNCIETQACAVQEAMLMKALVVTTRTGGVPESIAPVMTRFSVPEKNAAALAAAIAEVYDLPGDEMAVLGQAGREFVEQNYDIRELNRRMMTKLLA